MSFLPQEVIKHEVWIGGFQKRHGYRRQYPNREMQSNTHPNEWVECFFSPNLWFKVARIKT